jgi:hypothetical protein
VTICNGIRTAGTATPVAVYDLTSAEIAVSLNGVSGNNVWVIGLQVVCVADTLEDVCITVDDIVDAIDANYTDTGEAVKIVITQLAVAFSTENIDDGQHDAERVGTITITLQAQEY